MSATAVPATAQMVGPRHARLATAARRPCQPRRTPTAVRGSGPAAPMAPRICSVLPVRGLLDVKAKVIPDRDWRSRPPPPQETADE